MCFAIYVQFRNEWRRILIMIGLLFVVGYVSSYLLGVCLVVDVILRSWKFTVRI